MSASVSCSFQITGNTCSYSADASGSVGVESGFSWALSNASTSFMIEVVADPGDSGSGYIHVSWSASGSGTQDAVCGSCGGGEGYICVNGTSHEHILARCAGPTSDHCSKIIGPIYSGDIVEYKIDSADLTTTSGSAGSNVSSTGCSKSGSGSTSIVFTLYQENEHPPQSVSISCETIGSSGVATEYRYTFKNESPGPVTLTKFYLATMDLEALNYTSWIAPAGFTATVADWATLAGQYGTSTMATTLVLTSYGTVPSGETCSSSGGIVWTGSIALDPDQTATFGFDNPHAPVDMEWFAEHPDASNSSQGYVDQPVAGSNRHIHERIRIWSGFAVHLCRVLVLGSNQVYIPLHYCPNVT